MRILSIDSSTESATCAVLEEDKLLGEITFNYKKQHSVILMSMIQNLLTNLSLDIDDIDAYVICKGPGSFTGLRIGISTVKGLSQGSNKPLIGVSSLDALAYNMAYTPGIICPILDALRGNVYTALYKFNNSKLERLTEYDVISLDELFILLDKENLKVTFIGDGIEKFKDILLDYKNTAYFAPTHLNVVKASSLGELGLNLLKEGKCENLHEFAPIYIRKSQAEREYEEKNSGALNE